MKLERSVGIDCLRAVAIVWVLLYHFVPLTVFNRGTFGVLLFFIISGYCIAFSIDSSQSAWHFYAKRIGRLLPALIVCGFLTTLFKHLAPELVEHGREATWLHYAYTPVALATLNVVQKSYAPPDSAYWSLMIEFQFYFFCFMMMALGQKHRLIMMLCAVTVFRTLTTSPDHNMSNDFFPFFIAGMSVAALVNGRTKEAVAGLAVAACVELYHLAFHYQQPSAPIEIYRSMLLWAGTAAVYLAARYDHLLPRWFSVFAFIGLISYPLYLIHQDVGNMILRWAQIGREGTGNLLIRSIVLPIFLGLIAWIVYVAVEKPTIRPLTAFLINPRAWLRQSRLANLWNPVAGSKANIAR